MPVFRNTSTSPQTISIDNQGICVYQSPNGTQTVPQLFKQGKPLTYPYYPLSSGKYYDTNGSKWLCIYQDPTKSMDGYLQLSSFGIFVNRNGCFNIPSLVNYKTTNNNSGLTYNIENVRLSSSNTISSAAVRVAASSISTTYLNVCRWVAFENKDQTIDIPGADIYRGSGTTYTADASGLDDVLPWRSYIHNKNYMSTKLNVEQTFVSVRKPSSGYIHILAPMWNSKKISTDINWVRGWGIILAPTNTNEYPE